PCLHSGSSSVQLVCAEERKWALFLIREWISGILLVGNRRTNPEYELSLRGFWLQNWLSTDKAEEGRKMIDRLLGLVHDGKLKYKMELTPFSDFNTALDKALGKLGSQPKQVIKF
ncbi:putative trans-2-enoyl-CoA reductase mitochondrial-like, partial [Trifolium medium]|nr:putative trans-2-enoyl-CoA reductase mitochondrial-like [Trifolium medium]